MGDGITSWDNIILVLCLFGPALAVIFPQIIFLVKKQTQPWLIFIAGIITLILDLSLAMGLWLWKIWPGTFFNNLQFSDLTDSSFKLFIFLSPPSIVSALAISFIVSWIVIWVNKTNKLTT